MMTNMYRNLIKSQHDVTLTLGPRSHLVLPDLPVRMFVNNTTKINLTSITAEYKHSVHCSYMISQQR